MSKVLVVGVKTILCGIVLLVGLSAFSGKGIFDLDNTSEDGRWILVVHTETAFDGGEITNLVWDQGKRGHLTESVAPRGEFLHSLGAYVDEYGLPTKFVGYASGTRILSLVITGLKRKGSTIAVEYEATEEGVEIRVWRGKGTLFIDTRRLELGFATYRVDVKQEGGLKLQAVEWSNTPFTKLESR